MDDIKKTIVKKYVIGAVIIVIAVVSGLVGICQVNSANNLNRAYNNYCEQLVKMGFERHGDNFKRGNEKWKLTKSSDGTTITPVK